MKRPLLVKTADDKADDNFRRIADTLELAGPLGNTEPVVVTLEVGDNPVKPPGRTRPRGAIITFRSAVADIYDKGLDASSRWVFNSSAPVTIHVVFI